MLGLERVELLLQGLERRCGLHQGLLGRVRPLVGRIELALERLDDRTFCWRWLMCSTECRAFYAHLVVGRGGRVFGDRRVEAVDVRRLARRPRSG